MKGENLKNFILGIGTGGFSRIVYFLDMRLYPHNIFLEVLCELGFIGLVLIIWHFISIYYDAIRTLLGNLTQQQKILLFTFIMVSIFGLMFAQFSGDLNDNRRLWFYLGSLVAVMSLPNIRKNEGKL